MKSKLHVILLGKTFTVISIKPLILRELSIDYGIELSFEEGEAFKAKHNPKGDIIIREIDECIDGLHLIEGRVHSEPWPEFNS